MNSSWKQGNVILMQAGWYRNVKFQFQLHSDSNEDEKRSSRACTFSCRILLCTAVLSAMRITGLHHRTFSRATDRLLSLWCLLLWDAHAPVANSVGAPCVPASFRYTLCLLCFITFKCSIIYEGVCKLNCNYWKISEKV